MAIVKITRNEDPSPQEILAYVERDLHGRTKAMKLALSQIRAAGRSKTSRGRMRHVREAQAVLTQSEGNPCALFALSAFVDAYYGVLDA